MLAALLTLGAQLAGATAATLGFIQGALVVYGISEARRQAKRARQAREASFRDRTITVRSSNAPAQIVYGRALTSGVLIAPPITHGDDRRYLSAAIYLASHEVQEIEDILLDGESIGPLDARGYVQSGSSYWKTQRTAATRKVASAGASGSTITLDHTPDKIESVAFETADSVTEYIDAGSTGYTLSGRVLTLNTDRAQGRPLTVTYQYTGPMRSTSTDESFDGVPATLPHTAIRIISVVYRYFPADDPGVEEGATRQLAEGTDYTWDGADTITITEGANLQASPNGTPQLQTIYEHEQQGVALVQVKKFLGLAAGERDQELEVASGGIWTSQHLGKGIARIRVTIQYDEDFFPGGMPEISAIVKGKKVYDPRTDTTAWSDNPALCIADYQTDPLGYGMPTADVDWDSVEEAADDCDVLVNYDASNQHERFRLDGVVYCDAGLRENRDAMVTTIGGWAGMTGGKFVVRTAKDRTPTVGLTDRQLAGGFEIQVDQPFRDLYNSVRGQFINPSKGWLPDDFPPYPQDDESPYVVADGGRLYQDFDFPFTTNVHRAQRLAKLRLFRIRQPLQDVAVYNTAAAVLQPLDTVNLAREMVGWDPAKRFLVHDWRLDPASMTVQLTVQEDAGEVYAEDYSELRNPDPTPNTVLPDPRAVPALTGVTVAADATTFRILSDGSIEPYLRFTWDAVTASTVRKGGYVEILYKRAIHPEWDRIKVQPYETEYQLLGVRRGDVINYQIRAVNGLEVRSESVIGTYVMGNDTRTAGQPSRSGNRAKNAAFAWPMYGWSWGTVGNGGDGTMRRPETADRLIDGAARNIEVTVSGQYNGDAGRVTQTFSLEDARRFCFYVDTMLRDCSAWLEVTGEAFISSVLTEEVWRWRSDAITAGSTGDDARLLESYRRLSFILDLDTTRKIDTGTFIIAPRERQAQRVVVTLVTGPNTGDGTLLQSFWARPWFSPLPKEVVELPEWAPGDAQQPTFDAQAGSSLEQSITTVAGTTYKDDIGEISVQGGGELWIRLEARVRLTSASAHKAFVELGWSPDLTPGGGVASGRIVTMPAPGGSGVEWIGFGAYTKNLGVVPEGTHTYRLAAISRPDTGAGASVPAALVVENWQARLYFREPA